MTTLLEYAILQTVNKLSSQERAHILQLLCEGMESRSIVRVTGVSKRTVTKLLLDAGVACQAYHDLHVRNLSSRSVQCDEIWSFCYAKQKNVANAKAAPAYTGDVWTWTAIDADSKLAVSWLVGGRDAGYATEIMNDVAERLSHRVQLTTDGHRAYLEPIEGALGADVDNAQLVRVYGAANTERHCTRLTNAFSRKIENHTHAVALHFMHYNFVRIHKTLRVTPAMAAGVTKRLWEMSDIVELVDAREGTGTGHVARTRKGIQTDPLPTPPLTPPPFRGPARNLQRPSLIPPCPLKPTPSIRHSGPRAGIQPFLLPSIELEARTGAAAPVRASVLISP